MLMTYCEQYAESEALGSVTSKLIFLIIIVALKKVFTDDEIKELPVRYSIMFVLIPTGSIYIMNNIFMLGYKVHSNRASFHSAITAGGFVFINGVFFFLFFSFVHEHIDILYLYEIGR